MVEQFLNHIQRHNLCKTTDKILLAVSGGIDSIVMVHLFRQAGFTIAVAHCNFQLRGADSAADEAMVNSTCREHQIPFHIKHFDTKNYATENGISIQMAARELRYNYFKTLLTEFQYDALATAHHFNDTLETVLLNLVKGSGIQGMSGIPLKKGKIIRPMLFASKEQIIQYAVAHKLQWREDVSNESDDYQRNFIRHQIIPLLRQINPNLEETFRNTAERLAGANELLKTYLLQIQNEAFQGSFQQISIDKKRVLQTSAPGVLLWELIKDKGFNYEQCRDIVNDHQAGKKFYSDTHQLTIDRQAYLIHNRKNDEDVNFVKLINEKDTVVYNNHGLLQLTVVSKASFQLDRTPGLAQVAIDKIKYPLVWRSWKPGDSFVPLGMNQSKKLSDFLIDMKISLTEKEKITVIESAGVIIWVVGLRIHDNFKVSESTDRILAIRFIESSV